jgi:ATP-dependent Clp protease ATP-binding subunit ClpA
MKNLIINHLKACSGNAMIIFDEVQKVAPGTLEILRSGLRERGSFTTATGVSISTVNTIFLFISDIGASQLQNLILQHEDRDFIPIQTIQINMKNALDEQWKRLRFGETIRNVIPFLPMETPQIEAVFRLKLKSIARRQRHIFWANLIVENSLINHLSGTKSIQYNNYTKSFTGPSGDKITRSKLFAKGGARSIENGKL